MNNVILKVKKLRDDAFLPVYSEHNQTCAGVDIHAVEDRFIQPTLPVRVPTGIAVEIIENPLFTSIMNQFSPKKKYYMKLESRSGLASKGIFVVGGIIDQDYRGEVQIILLNASEFIYQVKRGDRIAQGIIYEIPFVTIQEDTILTETERGQNGFGSSGV